MATEKANIQIITHNPDFKALHATHFPDNIWIKNTGIATLRTNPKNIAVSFNMIEKMEKTAAGFVKVNFGQGLTILAFSGTMALYSYADGQKNYNAELKDCVAWKFWSSFADFVMLNQKYEFSVQYFGFLSGLSYENPILKGTLTQPNYEQSSENPNAINFSFTFQGVLQRRNYQKDSFDSLTKSVSGMKTSTLSLDSKQSKAIIDGVKRDMSTPPGF